MTNSKYICTKPFTWLELGPNGVCWMCCSAWVTHPIGNILEDSFEDVWNGIIAQEMRKSMYDGSYKYCNDNCPFKKNNDGPIVEKEKLIKDESLDKRMRDAISQELTVLPYKPLQVNAVYDRSCNLSCPSCRVKVIVAIGIERDKVLEIQDKMTENFMDDCHYLSVTGSGDPFGSPNFRKLLQKLDPKNFPQLWHVHLHTNAQLWTKRSWEKLHKIHHLIQSAEISIDACTEKTYSINRRGGNWERLLNNLDFISKIKVMRGFPKKTLQPLVIRISFVVQQNNWKEMKDFVKLGRKYGFNIMFSKLVDWGTWTKEELESRQVHLPNHPEHKEFVKYIKDPLFQEKDVQLGNLRHLLKNEKIPFL